MYCDPSSKIFYIRSKLKRYNTSIKKERIRSLNYSTFLYISVHLYISGGRCGTINYNYRIII